MSRCTLEMCHLAFNSLETFLKGGDVSAVDLTSIPDVERPLFVTWNKKTRTTEQLRGCIGILSPIPIHDGIPRYSLIAALKDTRFTPIELKEMPTLSVTVSLLVDFEDCSPLDWEVGTHGITLEMRGHRGVFLPMVAKEQGWDRKTTLLHLMAKAGLPPRIEADTFSLMKCQRFQSSTSHMTYKEYKKHKK
eukprot:gnl/Dysnectes_brevis/7719_a13234_309.p2 GENE.gnl/Dysnectes_brevis/7719_a13234_309~~gnl/Dysnectes_brevis/7719_a13234_309.p2  ORF type:complete len:191 (-),score=50.55 gnl/Dysnectes_brevis/7719_a13234_309:63-635(-)